MLLGKIVGTVVSSSNSIDIAGAKYLLVDKCNQGGKSKGDYLVALDLVGANRGEVVFIAESTSARETPETTSKAVDAIVVGIIDLIDESGTVTYQK